ncbi:hypothetical protein [Myxococcus sp. Y35]
MSASPESQPAEVGLASAHFHCVRRRAEVRFREVVQQPAHA